MNKGIGLVLAGGGGKGAYFIGVWKALNEYGVDKNVIAVSGTSVGALNAILFAQGNYEVAESVWRNISIDKILKVDIKKVIVGLLETGIIKGEIAILSVLFRQLYRFGIFSREGLLEVINNNVNLEYIKNSSLDIFAAAYNISSLEVEYFNINIADDEKIKKILLASSALPIIFDKEEIDGKYYIDGGIKDNVPIKPLYDNGIRSFIVVHLGRESIVSKEQFKDANIIEVVPSRNQGDLIDGTLDFSQEGVDRRINQGYEDTIKILKSLYEMGVVQAKIETTLEQLKKDELNFINQKKELLNDRYKIKNELHRIMDD